jgi:parallel beta-helix repeat protein
LLYVAAACCLIAVFAVIGLSLRPHGGPQAGRGRAPGPEPSAGGVIPTSKRVCGQPVLDSPYTYDGPAGSYRSGTAGLPTYGTPQSDFPSATAGMVLPTGLNDYLSYQLSPDTVYYLLPGIHVSSFQADKNDAFVGGRAGRLSSVLTGDYAQGGHAISSNGTIGNQSGVTIEYLTIEKYEPEGNAAAINQNANTNWTLRYNTIALNAPGAGVILGTGNVLKENCLTLNGQYGFQATDVSGFAGDSLTHGPYDITVTGNEISYNDTCDFEGKMVNAAIGWSAYNPVPERHRNPHCGTVVPDGNEGGFKLWQTNGVTIKNNYIHNNWGPGAWVDTGNANTTFTGNTFTDNDRQAIIEEISYNFSITGNYMARNDWVGGLGNSRFPSMAIYISESGSDRTFGGVPGCAEAACADQGAYPRESVISNNTLVNNGGNIFLWQNSNRFCSDSFDGICTWVKGGSSGPFSIAACRANLPTARANAITFAPVLTGSPAQDWWDGCRWRTENVSITHNEVDFNPADVMHCNPRAWPDCGSGGVFSEYGSPPGNGPGWATASQLTFFQHNTWADNAYHGPSTFYAWNQGNGRNPVSWANWTGRASAGDRCSSPGERQSGFCTGPFGQDTGSTYDPHPPGTGAH